MLDVRLSWSLSPSRSVTLLLHLCSSIFHFPSSGGRCVFVFAFVCAGGVGVLTD
jgi:hypothetical protein